LRIGKLGAAKRFGNGGGGKHQAWRLMVRGAS
jgi:hypothetical protein